MYISGLNASDYVRGPGNIRSKRDARRSKETTLSAQPSASSFRRSAASKNRILFLAAWVIGLLAGILCTGLAAEDGKSQELNRALADIKTTEQMINQRTAFAEGMRQRLMQQADELIAEILVERRRTNVASFPQARQVSRIDYNLRLVQRLLGYIDRLDGRIGYFRSAMHTLEFYRRQIRDDMLILRTLNDADTASLMRQLAFELDHLKNQSERPLLTASASGLRPLESIWSDVLQRK